MGERLGIHLARKAGDTGVLCEMWSGEEIKRRGDVVFEVIEQYSHSKD